MINDVESGESVIHVGVDFDCKYKCDVRENGPQDEDETTGREAGAYLLELIQVGLTFE